MKVAKKQPEATGTAELWLVIQSVREGHNILKEFGENCFDGSTVPVQPMATKNQDYLNMGR